MKNDSVSEERSDSQIFAPDSFPVPSLEWRLIDVCNYKCEYCGEGRHDPNRPRANTMSDDLIERTLKVTQALPGCWRITFSSGEPTLHPRLVELCGRVVDQGHVVSLVTNFSMSVKKQRELVEACGDRLEFLHASLHLSQVGVPEFLERAVNFNSIKSAQTSLEIATVMIPEKFDLLQRLYEEFSGLGLNLKFQFQRDGAGFFSYSPEIERFMQERAFQRTFQLRGKSFWGKLCHAGEFFFLIERNGDCFRCFEMRAPWSYLGSIRLSTFRRFDAPKPCLSNRCQCLLVPRRRLTIHNSSTTRAARISHAFRCSLRGWRYECRYWAGTARAMLVRHIMTT